MSYNSINEPFKLRRQFRLRVENYYILREIPWEKTILDLDNGTYFGRTPQGWLNLLFFYGSFYGALALFSAFCYLMFDGTIEYRRPKWNLKQPGLSLAPSAKMDDFDAVITYATDNDAEISRYINSLEDSLAKYGEIPDGRFGPCRSNETYGYPAGEPCIFLKINRVIGFKAVTVENPNELPLEAPNELYGVLSRMSPTERKRRIWATCEAVPSIAAAYHPHRSFDVKTVYSTETIEYNASQEYIDLHGPMHSRFYREDDYDRIIAVQLRKVKPYVRHRVVCALWAKNIERNLHGRMGQGFVRFELMITGNKTNK